jgi:thiosulfate/3-mercaptopyruvate sulfurtransferase
MNPSNADDAATVDVEWIATHIGHQDVRLVEVDVSPATYRDGHIPGAVLWNAYADLRDQNYRPVGLEELQRLLSRSGISSHTRVVTYGYAAPLGFWLLKAHGHRDVRMLMGSRDQWPQAGHHWSTDVTEPPDGAHPPVREEPHLFAPRDAVGAAIHDPSAILLDVRAESEYSGERFWPSGATEDVGRAGRIPGSVNVPIDSLRAADGSLKSPEELSRIVEHAGLARDKAVITYCTIGNRASEAWFALKYLLDYPSARVYYGSWVEWGKAADTPIET